MALYDYECSRCKVVQEVVHPMSYEGEVECDGCGEPMKRLISAVFSKRSETPWVRDLNGFVNDLEMVNQGRMRPVETREDARDYINHLYKDPYLEPKTSKEVAANKRVGTLRTRYLERL